jgi:TOMM system kinase/cyclase fusion protein
MTFEEVLDQAIAMLQRRGRVTYRTLKRQFQLDDEAMEDLQVELIKGQRLAVDEAGEVLVWTGAGPAQGVTSPGAQREPSPLENASGATPATPEAERRQLTVMFCDLVDSTALASQLDPEDLRQVIRAYQATCAEVIQRFAGHIAQYLGDGLLVYFGYPQAHEDDAQRAVRTGLAIVQAMGTLNARLVPERGVRLAVRLGIHTGLVVVGEIGEGARQEQLALGETPNVAARLQGLAAPDTVVISAATWRLVRGYFVCQEMGAQALKGVATPVALFQVLHASAAQSRLDAVGTRGLTPLVGRDEELGLLRQRWEQAQAGLGQVVVLTGEAGIGKSRLVQILRDQIVGPAGTHIECRCLPYTQHSALYPVITQIERVLAFARDDAPDDKARKLEAALAQYPWSLPEVVPLFAALLSLPLPAPYAPLTLTPQRQRQRTLESLLTWLMQETERQPVLFVMEDLHWVDPSTLEWLSLLVDQSPTARLLLLCTRRPEVTPPWPSRAHLTPLTLTRLPSPQVARLVASVAGAKVLPRDVVQQIVAKTDGVPLFVEELTKTVLESGLLQEREDRYELTGPLPALAIPATLQDSLMARLDRLATVKAVAQLGATIGRQFPYELLQAVSVLDEATLQRDLGRLVEAELLYQRGVPPQATYTFKHALIQDAASQSLLRSTRQQYHQRIAQVLAERFPETAETQPELLAHHYTEAGLNAQAIPYWQRAGERALQRSANLEAISHLTRGLEVLCTLPESHERAHQELGLQLTLGPAEMNTKGTAAPEVERTYARACELCRQVGDTPQLFLALWGFWYLHMARGQLQRARALGEEYLELARQQHDPLFLLHGHRMVGNIALWQGELVQAHAHVQEGLTYYDPEQHRAHAVRYSQDSGVNCSHMRALTLWMLGYPDQAQQGMEETLVLARELGHPFTLAQILFWSGLFYQLRREPQVALVQVEEALALCTEQGFALYLTFGTVLRGWALAAQGQSAEGIAQLREGFAAFRATGAGVFWPWFLAMLAEAYGQAGQINEGLRALEEALEAVQTKEDRCYEAEVYRLKGVLLQKAPAHQEEAEEHLQQALQIARRQQARSFELRAAMSLAHLWMQQGKRAAARQLLADIYGWFTEGFDTADLREATALLDELA